MKKLISGCLFICFVLSGLVYAKNPACHETVFNIQNASSSDCILKDYKLLKGDMFEQSPMPDIVYRGQTTQFVVTESKDDRHSFSDYRYSANTSIMLYLNYQCGNDQSISLLSQTRPGIYCSIGGEKSSLEGFVLSKSNIEARFSKVNNTFCSAWEKSPRSEINWMLIDY